MFEWSIDWLISKNGQLTGKFISQVKVAKSQPYSQGTLGAWSVPEEDGVGEVTAGDGQVAPEPRALLLVAHDDADDLGEAVAGGAHL